MANGLKIRTRLLIGALVLVGLLALQLLVVLPKQLNELGVQGAKARAAAISALTSGAIQPGLAFEDEMALNSALSPLSKAPDVRYALVFNVDGELIARHPQASTPPELRLSLDSTGDVQFEMTDDQLHAGQTIVGLNGPLGRLQIGLSSRNSSGRNRPTSSEPSSHGLARTHYSDGHLALASRSRAPSCC